MNKLIAITVFTLLSIVLYHNYHNDLFSTTDYQVRFENYLRQYNKRYLPTEKAFRKLIYEQNLRSIEKHNADPEATYQLGETQFSDLTQEEFETIYLTYHSRSEKISEFIPQNAANPTVDWSGLTDVKNQGKCGSYWAFSAIGAIESVLRVKGSGTKNLSEQQLVDCDINSYRCGGGWVDRAITWSAQNGNNLESAYPYLGKEQSCQFKTGAKVVSGVDYIRAENLYAAITNYPVAVEVDATKWSQYKSGIFSNCGAAYLNHAVVAVGYYADGTWIIKNSWGTTWGEAGYIRLAAGDTCGVTQDAVIAVL